MTWSAPTPDLLPPPPVPPRSGPGVWPPPPTEGPAERRRRSGLPAATWIALLGGALVLVAATSIVVSNWDAIGKSLRVIGLVIGTGGLLAASERLRAIAPTTADVVAHVGTFLTTAVGVSAMSLAGFTWPTCLLVGGVVAFAASWVQADRWHPEAFRAGQVGAIAIAATGAAALTGTSAGLIASLAAVGLLLVGAGRRAVALSIAAVLSPVLTALADAGIGAGTLERAGLVGERLGWSGPVVGLLAAITSGVVAHRRGSNTLALVAAAAPILGVVTGLAAVDATANLWWSIPALVVIAVEIVVALLPSERFRDEIVQMMDALVATIAACSLVAPLLVGEVDLGSTASFPWAVPAALTAAAMALVTTRWHRGDHSLVDLGTPATLVLTLSTLIAFDLDPLVLAPVAVGLLGTGAFASRRLHPAAVYVPAFWAFVAIGPLTTTVGSGRWIVALALTLVGFGIVVATRGRIAPDGRIGRWVEIPGVVLAGAVMGAELVDAHAATAALAGVAVVGTIGLLLDRRWVVPHLATAGAVGLVATAAATDPGGYDSTGWIGWVALAAGLAGAWWVHRDTVAAHAAAATTVVATAAWVAGTDLSSESAVAGGMGMVALLTGLAVTRQRRTPLDSAAATAGVLLALAGSLPIHPAWISGIWVVLGLQATAYGLAKRQPMLSVAGALTTAVAFGSWWFTTGLDDWFRELIAPADITAADLWALTAMLTALAVGHALRRVFDLNSWLAYGAGLAIGGVWLVATQLDREPVWAIPAAVTLGVVAAGLGAWHRLAAPLVGGTIITTIATFVALGSDLRAIPTWTWLAIGGLGLLGVAVLIERTSKQGTSLRDLVERWG